MRDGAVVGGQGLGDEGRVDGEVDAAVLPHVAEAVGRVLRVEGDVGRAGLEDGEGGDHQVRGTGQRDADPAFRSGAQAQQVPGELVGAAAQLRVGERGRAVQHGDGLGPPGDPVAGHLHDRAERAGPAELGRVLRQDGGALGRLQHGEAGQRQRGRGDRLLGEGQPVPAEPVHRRRVEQAGAVLRHPDQGAVVGLLEVQAQVELGGRTRDLVLLGGEAGQGEAAARGVLERDHGLHQRGAARVALGGQLLDEAAERHVLVGEGVERGALHLVQQVGEGAGGVDLGAQDQRVDEEADQALQFGPLASGDGGAQGEVAAARVAGQGQLGHRRQAHEEAGAPGTAQLRQAPGQRGRDGEQPGAALRRPDLRARAVRRQVQRLQPGQPLAPVGELGVERLAGVLLALPDGEVRVLDGECGQGGVLATDGGGVQLAEFAGDDPHRPAVGDDVVHRQHQDVLGGSHPDQQDPQQRAGAQVERPDGLGPQHRVHLAGAGDADGPHRHLDGVVDDLDTPAVDRVEGGAQRLVPGDQARHRAPQRRLVERAGQAQRADHVVLDGARREVLQEPQAFLRQRHGQLPAPGHRDDGRPGLAGVLLARAAVDLGGEAGHRRVVEEGTRGEVRPEGRAGPGGHLQAGDGVAAETEEVVVDTDPVRPQHLGPDRAQGALGGGAGLGVRGARRGELRGGQGAPVDLAVDGQRDRVDGGEGGRDHVLGQRGREMAAQRLRVERAPVAGDEVGGEVLGAGPVRTRQDGGVGEVGVGEQGGLDLGRLDAVAADLDLGVGTPEEVDAAVAAPAGQVAGAVEASPRVVRVGDEPLGGQARLVVIAPGHAAAAEVQLTRNTDRHGTQGAVQDVGGHRVHRRAQRRRAVRHVLGGQRAADGEGGGLGGAVAVDQGQAGVVREQGVRGVVRDGVAAGPDLLQPGEAGRVLLDEDAEEGGGDPQGGDALGDGLANGGRRQVAGGHRQGAAAEQRYPDLVGGGVEGVRGVEQHPLVGVAREAVVGGERHDVGVGHPDALGDAGRAGGEHDVRQGAATGRGGQRRTGVGPGGQVARVEGGDAGQGGLVAVGEDEGGAAAAEDVAQALLGLAGVERDVGAARLEHGEHRHHHVGGAFQEQPHPGLGGHPAFGQGAGQTVGAPVERAVGQRGAAGGDGDGVRGGGGPPGEDLHHRTVHRGPGPLAPLAEQAVAFGAGQQLDLGDRCLGPLDQAGHGGGQLAGQPLGGGLGEEGRVVGEGQAEAVAGGRRDQRQGVVGRLDGLGRADADAVPGGGGLVHRVVLEDDQAVEEGGAGRQVRLDVGEGHVLEAAGLRLLVLDAAQPVGGADAGGGAHPDGQGVDEEAEQRLGAGQVGRAARDGGAEHHVVAARVLAEYQCPGALDQGVLGDPVVPGVGAGAFGDGRVQRHRHAGAGPAAPHLLGRVVVRQRHRLLVTGQRAAPVAAPGLLVLPGEPAQVVAEGATGRGGGGAVAAQHGVLGQYVGEEGGGAPAVQEQVVEGPHQLDAAFAGQPDQRHPHQRGGGQVDAARPVLVEELAQERVLGLLGEGGRGAVEEGDRHLGVAAHHLDGLADALPDQPDAQRVGALHRPLPGVGQPRGVVDAVQGEDELLQVGGGVGFRQGVEEHAGLERGQRVDVLDRAAVPGDPVHLALVEGDQGEVRGRAAAGTGLRAVRDEGGELGGVLLDQRADRLLAVHARRVVPGEDEPAVEQAGGHVEEVRPVLAGAVLPARVEDGGEVPGVRGGVRRLRGGARQVEPAQVVEADQGGVVLREVAAEVAQGAVADAPVRDGAQLLLDRGDGRSPPLVLGQRERHRVDGGEPARRTGQVEVGEEFLTAVALQADRDPVAAGPAAQGAGEGGEEGVVDLGAVDRRDLLEELVGLGAGEFAGDRGGGHGGGVARRVVQRQ